MGMVSLCVCKALYYMYVIQAKHTNSQLSTANIRLTIKTKVQGILKRDQI